MVLIKSAIGALLCAIFVSATGPALFQDAGPGAPDDIAELLPADTVLFAEVTRAPLILRDWKDYVGTVCTADGKTKVCESIEKAVKEGLDIVPEKLLKDLETGLPTLQRLAAVLMFRDGTEPAWAVIATSSDAAFFGRIMNDDLKVFSFEERKHQEIPVLAIRKLGEMKFHEPLLVAAPRGRLVVTAQWETMTAILDRAAGKGSSPDLRKNPLYAKFATSPADGPSFRGFAFMPWKQMMGPSSPGAPARSTQHELDTIDAVTDALKVRGATVEATLSPNKVAARGRIHVESPCRLLEAWSQPAGPKDVLAYVPSSAQLAVHFNLKSGAKVWSDIRDMITRMDTCEAKQGRERRGTLIDELTQEFQGEIGLTPEELAEIVGNELSLAFVGDECFASGRNAQSSVLLLGRASDPAKARAAMEKLAPRMGSEPVSDGDATLWIAKEERRVFSFALDGSTILVGFNGDVLHAALKAKREGTSAFKTLPEGAATASKMIAVKNRALWTMVDSMTRGKLGDFAKELDLETWASAHLAEDKDGVTMSSDGACSGWLAQTSLLSMPLLFAVMSSGRAGAMMEATGEALPKQVGPKPEPKAIAADELAAKVKAGVEELHAEEMDKRDAAAESLRALGRQAAALIVEAVKKESDLEAKEQLIGLLIEWRVYDALPELLTRKIDAFVKEYQDVVAKNQDRGWGSGFVAWPYIQQEGMTNTFPWAVEPYFVNYALLDAMTHRDVLNIPQGLAAVAAAVQSDRQHVNVQRQLAAILAYVDCSKAEDAVVAAREAAADVETKVWLQIALGWLPGAKARDMLVAGVKDPNRWVSRASFIGLDRGTDASAIPKLLAFLKDADHETRWNASFTLRRLTRGGVAVNVYRPDDEVSVQVAGAEGWWKANEKTFKIAK